MSEELDLKALHRKFAVDCFNGVWGLLDKGKERTPEEEARMIHMAHASRFHWGEIGTTLQFARGDWQISRVYAMLGLGAEALRFAESSLKFCTEHGHGDFDLAFAYEAVARAHTLLGNQGQFGEAFAKARAAGEAIADEENRNYFFSELQSISGALP